jgi:hypothetical protein
VPLQRYKKRSKRAGRSQEEETFRKLSLRDENEISFLRNLKKEKIYSFKYFRVLFCDRDGLHDFTVTIFYNFS